MDILKRLGFETHLVLKRVGFLFHSTHSTKEGELFSISKP
jgi:hypothetical protein